MTIRSNLASFLLLGFSVVGTAWVHAEEVLPWSVSVTEENDKFTPGNKDRYYTQGLKVAINRPDDIFFSIAQEINTPSDTLNPPSVQPPYTDLPYSGALYLGAGFGRVFERGGRRDIFFAVEAKLGVIGPSAGGETVQNKFHQLIGTPQAVGWGTQLPDEILMNVDVELRRRFDLDGPESDHWDLIARSGLMLGTMRSQFQLGGQLRRGDGLNRSWGQTFLRHSTSYDPVANLRGAGQPRTSFWFFADGQVEVVARNYATDGTNFRDSQAVSREPIVLQTSIGFSYQHADWSLSYYLAARTREFEKQDGMHLIGGLKAQLLY